MDNLVLNEWFLHDLNYDNGEKKLRETSMFLSHIIHKDNFRIFILGESPWIDKARKMAANPKEPMKTLTHLLFGKVLRDSEKCGIIRNSELSEVPEEILLQMPQEDVYLIKLAFTVAPCILFSTDNELIANTKRFESEIKVSPFHRDDFISHIIH